MIAARGLTLATAIAVLAGMSTQAQIQNKAPANPQGKAVGRVEEGQVMVSLRPTSVSGFPRTWLNSRMAYTGCRPLPHQTGHADFPHPALPNCLAPRHAQG